MKNLINKFESVKGASFVSINNYLAKTSGEVANHTVNINVSVKNAKLNDLQTLKNCTESDLNNISKLSNLSLDVLKTALAEMLTSAEKNLSEKIEDRTAQSQAQTDTYFHITPAIKIHKDTFDIYIFGQTIKKDVLVSGEFKTVNSSAKTLAKKAITKHLDLRAGKFREYCLGNIDTLKIAGTTFQIV